MALSMFLLRNEELPSGLRAARRYRELRAGELLYRRGEVARSIFGVERGRLRLFSHTSEGRPVPLHTVRAGECVSEAALYAENYCGDVMAEVPSKVAEFSKAAVLGALHENPFLSDEFGALMTRRFNLLRIRLELRNLPSASERVVQYLKELALPGENAIAIDRPLKSIAEDLGLTPESFYRTLKQLAQDGVIVRRKGVIQFVAPRAE